MTVELRTARPRKYRMRRDEDGRLRRVATYLGHEGYHASFTDDCSGCTDIGDYGTKYGPFGCHECGYTGKRRSSVFVPFDAVAYYGALDAPSDRVTEESPR